MSLKDPNPRNNELQASNDRLSRSIESARLGTWDWNIETGELIWSRECMEMFGLAVDLKMSYERFIEAIYPEDREKIDDAVKVAMRTGDEYSTEMRAVWPDGTMHWIASRGRVYFDKSGKPVRMSGAGMDITRLKETEEELKRARAETKAHADNLAAVLDAVPALTFFTDDPQCRTMTAGRFAREVFGLPEGANISMSVSEGVRPKFVWLEDGRVLEPEELPVQQAAATGRVMYDKELEVRFPSGKTLHLYGNAFPLLNAAGGVRGAVGAFLDITGLKQTEDELKQAKAEAKAQADNLAAIFDAVPAAAFFSHDRKCEKVTSNRAAYELLRMTPGTNTSLSSPDKDRPTFTIWDHGSEVPADELPLQKAATTGQAVRNKEFEIRFDDGSSTYEFGHAVPLFDEAGQVRGAIGAFMDITDRKVIEERLRATTERFQIALRGTPMTVFNQGLDLRYKWIYNPASGYNPADIIGKRDTEFLERHEDAVRLEAIKSEVIRTGQIFQGEVVAHLNGAPRTYHVTIEPQRDPWGRIIGLTCASYDLTDRKDAEAERETLARQRQLALDAVRMGWWHYDAATAVGTWDETFRSIFGLSTLSGPTDEVIQLIHPEDRPMALAKLREAMDPLNPRAYITEYRIIRPDGTERWVETYGAAEVRGEGTHRKVVSCSGTIRDITDRHRAAHELRISEERYRKLFETMAEGLAICELVRDESGRAVDIRWLACNAALERLTGLRREAVVGHLASEVFPTEYKWWVRTYENVIKEGQVFRFEQGSESAERVWDLTAFAYEGDHFAVLYDDITTRKQAEDALRTSESRYRDLATSLEQQVQLRTQELQHRNEDVMKAVEELKLISSRILQVQDEERRRIARELHDSSGQILTAIGLDLANIAEQAQLEKVQATAPELKNHVAQAQELVDLLHRELRTTSYLLHPPLLDETGLFSAISWYAQGMTQRSGLQIDFDFADDFGRLPRETELLVFRIVQESLTNIHRHSGSKTASIRITRDAEVITVDITDQGRGIPPEKLEAIQAGSSGLGIRAMRERLRQFGGGLTIDSGGSGTRVVATIPSVSHPQEDSGVEAVRAAI